MSIPTSVRLRAVRVLAGALAVHADPLPLPVSLQLGELPLQMPLLSFQNLQLVLTPPVRLFKFLERAKSRNVNRFPVRL